MHIMEERQDIRPSKQHIFKKTASRSRSAKIILNTSAINHRFARNKKRIDSKKKNFCYFPHFHVAQINVLRCVAFRNQNTSKNLLKNKEDLNLNQVLL